MGRPYGSEIGPNPPQQDMWQVDVIAGSVHDRRDNVAEFTGGDGEQGLGGQAEGGPDGDTRYDRIGY